MASKVYQAKSGQWSFIIIDRTHGAGYESQEETQQAGAEKVGNFQ